MDIRFKITPVKTIDHNKDAAVKAGPIGNCFSVSRKSGEYFTNNHEKDYVYVYTAVKYRGKRDTDPGKRVSRWEVYTYRIPLMILQDQNLSVVQGPRTFKLLRKF